MEQTGFHGDHDVKCIRGRVKVLETSAQARDSEAAAAPYITHIRTPTAASQASHRDV